MTAGCQSVVNSISSTELKLVESHKSDNELSFLSNKSVVVETMEVFKPVVSH
jgi:hypothetical protein